MQTQGYKSLSIQRFDAKENTIFQYEISLEIHRNILNESMTMLRADSKTLEEMAHEVIQASSSGCPDKIAVDYVQGILKLHSPEIEKVELFIKTCAWIGTVKQPYTRSTDLKCSRNQSFEIELIGGIMNIVILKLNKSGFVNFNRDNFTVLPEATNRIMSSDLQVQWTFKYRSIGDLGNTKFSHIFNDCLMIICTKMFEGYSPSVQNTAYKCLETIMTKHPSMESIQMYAPNIHFVPFDVKRFGIEKDDVFHATEDPRGLIKVQLTRS